MLFFHYNNVRKWTTVETNLKYPFCMLIFLNERLLNN